jgi:serine/threonine-protein kinase
MGDVWRGTDLLLGRQVAVKILLPALVAEPDFITRFHAEARMMAALHHPGIVQVYDCGEQPLADGGRADYLVMEYVAGEPLAQRIKAAGRLDVEQTLSVVAQAARALDAAHRAGIVHRDVKPGNLLIQPDGTVVLVDFGVARSISMTRITSTNAIPGTALYMAPEQAAGRPVSASSDIYALGAVTYHCLAGQPPFSGRTPLEVAIRHLHDEPPALPAGLSAPVATLIGRALAKDPADRHPSAAAFAAAADAAQADAGRYTTGQAATARYAAGRVGTASDTAVGIGMIGGGAGTDAAGPGPVTQPELPIGPPARPGPSRRRVVAVAGVATLLTVGALLGVLGFGRWGGASREIPPPSPATSGAAPAARPSATEKDPGVPAPSGRTTGPSATAPPSAASRTGVPTRSGTGAPSPAPTTAGPTATPAATAPTTAPDPTGAASSPPADPGLRRSSLDPSRSSAA